MKKTIVKILLITAISGLAFLNVNFTSKTEKTNQNLLTLNEKALANCEFDGWIGNYEYYLEYITMCWWTCTQGGLLQCPI